MSKMLQKQPLKKPREEVIATYDSSDEDVIDMPMHLDDTSEYSEEEVEDLDGPYPFHEKDPQDGDFVLVELKLNVGRQAGTKVHYIAKILLIESVISGFNGTDLIATIPLIKSHQSLL